MGQQIYFDNYTAVGDIIVLSVCAVIGVLIATSFVAKTKSYTLFKSMVVYLALSALANIVLHDWYTHITDGNYTPIYVLRVLYHIFLFSLFLLYIVYFVHILELRGKSRFIIMLVSSVVYLAVILTDIIVTIRGTGFKLKRDGTTISGLNIFMFGYVAFLIIIVYLMIAHRKHLYKNAMIGVAGTIVMALIILYNQGRHAQNSLTVATFLFPIIAIMYLIHSNPFDIKTGAVSAASVADAVNYYHSKNHAFYFINLYLPDFHSEGSSLPAGIQSEIRQFPGKYFKRVVLYRINNGHMLLMMPAKNNPDFEKKVWEAVDEFKAIYERFRFDYKLIIGKSIEEISNKNEYLDFIRSIGRTMELNSVHIVEPNDVKTFNRTESILKEIEDISKRQDLNDGRVLAFCQPVLNISTGKYDTAEALMRLDLPEIGMVFPDQFIPLAEEYGYIHSLTRIILHKTCNTIRDMMADRYDVMRISVNVSVQELRDGGFTKDIKSIIASSGIPNEKVAIEITESGNESDLILIKSMIEELKGTGIKFYLDDFGTGYSNLERIMRLPFDIIKFDRSLVIASDSDKRSEEIVGRLAGMFVDLDYSVLYEGIEDEDDELRCINMSASYLQGYRYSRPVPMADLRDFFSKSA